MDWTHEDWRDVEGIGMSLQVLGGRLAALARRRAASFTPTNARAWWKAESLSALADGGDVTSWADSSGNGFNLTIAPAVTAPPVYALNQINGRPAMYFQGIQSAGGYLLPASNPMAGQSEGHSFSVLWTPGNTIRNGQPVQHFGGSGQNCHYTWEDGTCYEDFGASTRYAYAPALSVGAWRVYSIRAQAGLWRAYQDRSLAYSTTGNIVTWAPVGWNFGVGGNGEWNFRGYVAEILLCGALTDAQYDATVTYLMSKYGL